MDVNYNNEEFIFSKMFKNDAYPTFICSHSPMETPK